MTFPFGWRSLLGTALFVVDIVASLHVVLRKRDPRSAAGWVGIIWLVPGIGVLLYLVFGLNRIRRRGMELQRARRLTAIDAQPEDPEWLAGRFRPRQAGMARIAERLSGRRLLGGNSIEPMLNGDQAYPAMLAAIDGATRSVALSTYIFNDDRVGRRFIDALARAQQRGAEVCVLVDDIGLRYSFPPAHWAMKRAGISVARFLPILSKSLLAFFNLRSHRKLLVVDGTVAFAGGMNIQAAHVLGDAPKKPVRDVHFRLRGPVVRQLQDAFAEDWEFVTGRALDGAAWRSIATKEGDISARVLTAGPDLDFEIVRHVILGAIASARDSLRIMTPYFLPDTAMIAGLRVAALRGVRVDIVLPERGNIPMAQWASRALLWQLLKAGCRVYLTPPPFDHTKLFVVDRTWTLFGTTNWDARSLRLNFELDVECYDEGFAARTDDYVAGRMAESREFTLADADGRPFLARVRDGLARLLMPYL